MKIVVFLFLAFLGTQVDALEISNFKSGPMCGINMDDMGWVCFEDEEIHVTGQSSCWSQGEILKCTWYGFSFEYIGARKGQEIECRSTTTRPTSHVNLSSRGEEPETTRTYTFALEEKEGYFVNPQYSVLATSGDTKPAKIVDETECWSEGEPVFEFRFISIYPPDS